MSHGCSYKEIIRRFILNFKNAKDPIHTGRCLRHLEPALTFTDESQFYGWCGQYHAGWLHFPRAFFLGPNLGWPDLGVKVNYFFVNSTSLQIEPKITWTAGEHAILYAIIQFHLAANWTWDHLGGRWACYPLCYHTTGPEITWAAGEHAIQFDFKHSLKVIHI